MGFFDGKFSSVNDDYSQMGIHLIRTLIHSHPTRDETHIDDGMENTRRLAAGLFSQHRPGDNVSLVEISFRRTRMKTAFSQENTSRLRLGLSRATQIEGK